VSISESIFDICASDTTISGLIGGNLFPHFVPQDTALPAVVYEIIESDRIHLSAHDSKSKKIKLDITVICEGFSDSQALKRAFKACLNNFKGINDELTIQKCFFTGSNSAYFSDKDLYQSFLSFDVRFFEGISYYYYVDEDGYFLTDDCGGYYLFA